MKTIGRREFIYSAGYLLAAATLAGCQGGTNNAPQSNDSAQQAEREEQEEQNPTDLVDVEVKSGLSAYSWEELSEISQFIAEVKNGDTEYDFTANDVAVAFNLCSADGSLDAAETKTIVLDRDGEAQASSSWARRIGDCARRCPPQTTCTARSPASSGQITTAFQVASYASTQTPRNTLFPRSAFSALHKNLLPWYQQATRAGGLLKQSDGAKRPVRHATQRRDDGAAYGHRCHPAHDADGHDHGRDRATRDADEEHRRRHDQGPQACQDDQATPCRDHRPR